MGANDHRVTARTAYGHLLAIHKTPPVYPLRRIVIHGFSTDSCGQPFTAVWPGPVRPVPYASLVHPGLPAIDEAVSIGSLNLHGGMTAAGQPFNVPAAIGRLPADIVAVQETWWVRGSADGVEAAAREQRAQLIRAQVHEDTSLADLGIAQAPEQGSWGIAVLSRLPVTGYETVDLGRAPGDVISRTALICSVVAPGGWPLRLVNTHLTHKFTSPVQLRKLARHLAGSALPTVIAGDLNMPRLATWLAGGFVPTVRGPTYPAHHPLIQLDHLLAGPGVACAAATVLPPVGSDHRPVVGRFYRRPQPPPPA
jgi:endonuclease/exonuclease/phosphatase family metal-dependent hydrolase